MQAWHKLASRYDALTRRERIIIAVLLLVVVVVAWQEILISTLDARQKQLAQRIAGLNTQIASINKQADVIIQAATLDPDQAEQVRLSRLKQKLAALDESLKEKLHGLISPTDMAKALEAVLLQQTRLRLVKVQSLKAEPLFKPAQADAGAEKSEQQVGIYKHGMQIEFTGSYLHTLDYLKAVEALPWDFYWDGLELEVRDYPRAHVTIKVHTLSLDKNWIGV